MTGAAPRFLTCSGLSIAIQIFIVLASIGAAISSRVHFFAKAEELDTPEAGSTEPKDGHQKEIVVDAAGCKFIFRYVPAGEFIMGSPIEELGHEKNEEPARTVRITKGFYLSQYEVTQAQFDAIMGENPSKIKGEKLPCNGLRFTDALSFCDKLSGLSKKSVTLPTEAQWEYACRAGNSTRFHSGDTEADLARIGWYRGNAADRPHPVGEKLPNSVGIYDMHGNVAEFCIDSPVGVRDNSLPETDPVGHLSKFEGALRGGHWFASAERCRSASRSRTSLRFQSGYSFAGGIRLLIRDSDD